MAHPHFRFNAFPHTRRITQAAVTEGDFVIKGGIKGYALEDTRTDGDLAGTVLLAFGVATGVPIEAGGAGGGIVEGDYLLWDAALNGGDGAFTDTGASATAYDALAGAIADLAQGATTAAGEVMIPAPY